jgi:hypothetical protein
MNLTSWKGSIVRKQDIFIAKNYLTHDEIDTLNRLVVIFLESAELRAKNRLDITIDFWRENVDRILDFQDKKILTNAGSISKAEMEKLVSNVYAQFDQRRKEYEALQADNEDLEELKKLEQEIKTKRKNNCQRFVVKHIGWSYKKATHNQNQPKSSPTPTPGRQTNS